MNRMEKLNEIKEKSIYDGNNFIVCKDDFLWFIEQVKEAQKFREALTEIHTSIRWEDEYKNTILKIIKDSYNN